MANSRELTQALENLSKELGQQDQEFNKDFQLKERLKAVDNGVKRAHAALNNHRNKIGVR